MCTGLCEKRWTAVSGGRGKETGEGLDLYSYLCVSLLFSALWGQATPQCPDSCHCAWDTATVLCSNAGLREIPEGIPPETVSLHLERNYIRNIPESAFNHLVHLRDLYLSHNRIDSLSSGALRHLGPDLRLLDLSHNQLRQASREDFGSTRAKTRLYHNPWHCDCTLQELMETLNLEPETVNGIICESSVRGVGEGSRWEDPGSLGEHAEPGRSPQAFGVPEESTQPTRPSRSSGALVSRLTLMQRKHRKNDNSPASPLSPRGPWGP
ncbi:hypothetical protein ATANTOWER_011514 [Ataeniobius toweri]|uniref:LRRNT domain-containing protein n=1 Tax=Ataeniobius toweri TaxID=208326 RepID=A0ABU7AV28_9TELE|nr:hypothetical protein [Ataeniobius toweri]